MGWGGAEELRSAKESEDGRVRQAGLTQKLPSPALKEAERSGSYHLKPSEHPYEGSCTARHRARTHTVAGRATCAGLCDSKHT
jgi:hypothetical protein